MHVLHDWTFPFQSQNMKKWPITEVSCTVALSDLQLVFMFTSMWKLGKYIHCWNSLLNYTEYLNISLLITQSPQLQLVVTGWGNLASQLPAQTWIQRTWVENELCSGCNHSLIRMWSGPNTSVSQYSDIGMPYEGDPHNQPWLHTKSISTALNSLNIKRITGLNISPLTPLERHPVILTAGASLLYILHFITTILQYYQCV